MDVKSVFFHEDLDEKIYMEQPKGYEVYRKMPLVCKLNKCLYGLKQSPRKCYKNFDAFMRSQSYDWCYEDSCLYMKKCTDDSYVILNLDILCR